MESATGTGMLRALDTALGETAIATRFATDEPARAVKQLSHIYGPHALRLVQDGPVDLTIRSFELAQLHVAHVRYGVPIVAKMSQPHTNWVFSYLRSGTVRRGNDVFGPGAVGVGSPYEPIDVLELSPDAELINLRVEEEDMRAACRALLGSELADELRFEDRAQAGSRSAHALARVMKHIASAPRFDHPAARRYEFTVRDSALFELLLGWPNNAAPSCVAKAAIPESTRRARDYIHAHAIDAPTVVEIAQAAGVGVRALALGFDKHFGMSPLRYLQQVRLDGIRAQLQGAAAGDTVTRIALDWGFANLGVFAARYRERFGESPSETLRRQCVYRN
jgi:AraC-like DNA-binding protein